LLIETSHEFGREVLRGVLDYEKTLDNHWAFYLQPDGLRQNTPKIGSWPCTGFIARPLSAATARFLLNSNLPLVLLDPYTQPLCRQYDLTYIPYITTDASSVVRMAFEHLYACGCRSFAFVNSSMETVWSAAREQAFVTLAKQRGFTCSVYGVPEVGMSWEEDIRKLGEWLAQLPRGLGIFAAMDQRGRNVIEACRERELRVPDDVMVVSVDNDPLLCEMCEPSLSSVALDAHRAGYEAARMLHAQMSGEPIAPNTRILVQPTHVSRRQSTSSGFDQDRVVAAARRFIFDRLGDRSLQVSDIAAHCGVSRRSLETRFLQSVGKTLLQELIEMRMERAVHSARISRHGDGDCADVRLQRPQLFH
jgi:LacI family transcriptional regulator